MRKIVLAHLLRGRDGTVVGIMKKQLVAAVFNAVLPNAANELWIIPFVNDYDVGILEDAIKIQLGRIIGNRV